jgi:hypothetical protein
MASVITVKKQSKSVPFAFPTTEVTLAKSHKYSYRSVEAMSSPLRAFCDLAMAL